MHGYSILETLISQAILLVIINISMQCMIFATYHYLNVQQSFDYTIARLIAQHYILQDLHDAKHVYFTADQLNILFENSLITYALRPSILPTSNHMHALALYRKTPNSRFEALVEGIVSWHMHTEAQCLAIRFKDKQIIYIPI